MKRKKAANLRDNQQGVVAIIIVILIILLMSLVVVAMSRNANREQRQALDRQLNSQAFYAAESGINRFIEGYNELPDEPENGCTNDMQGALVYGSNIEVSCVLFDKTPNNLEYHNIALNSSTVIPIKSDKNITELDISFQANEGVAPGEDYDFSGCSAFGNSATFNFPSKVENCNAGILRLDIIPGDSVTGGRAGLINETKTLFIVPQAGSTNSTINWESIGGNEPKRVKVNCDPSSTPMKCNFKITNLIIYKNFRWFINARSIYQPNSLDISSKSLNNNEGEGFKEAQVMVDATGKAADILKRIQVRIPASNLGTAISPSFSLESSTDVCKLLQVRPGSTTTAGCNIN